MTYVKQGEDALQKAISILGEQDGWTTETVAVSTKFISNVTAVGTLQG